MRLDGTTLDEIREAIRTLVRHAEVFDRERFDADRKTRSAVLYEIIVLGEGIKRLSQAFRDRHPEVPWAKVAGMRDRVAHAYDRVDLDAVWRVVTLDAPAMLESLDRIDPEASSVE